MKTNLLFLVLLGLSFTGNAQDPKDIPDAPEGYRKPAGYNPVPHRYKYSLDR